MMIKPAQLSTPQEGQLYERLGTTKPGSRGSIQSASRVRCEQRSSIICCLELLMRSLHHDRSYVWLRTLDYHTILILPWQIWGTGGSKGLRLCLQPHGILWFARAGYYINTWASWGLPRHFEPLNPPNFMPSKKIVVLCDGCDAICLD